MSSEDNNWGKFITSSAIAVLISLGVGVLGANFVYLSRINLDIFFPTDENKRPYTYKSPELFKSSQSGGGKMKGGNKMSGGGLCGEPIDFGDSVLLKNKYFRGIFEYGFPYNMINDGSSIVALLKNWLGSNVMYSNIWLRDSIQFIITVLVSICALTPQPFTSLIPFILGPIILAIFAIMTSIWMLPTLVSMFWNEKELSGNIITILGLLFGYTWAFAAILSVIQSIEVIFKSLFLPLMLSPRKIFEIMGNRYNSYYLSLVLFTLIIAAAFSNLNIIVAVVMLLVFLPNLIPPGMNPFKSKPAN